MIDTTPQPTTDTDLIAHLFTLVMRGKARATGDGDIRQGEVALYCDAAGCFSVQLRRRDGSAVEFGRHSTLRQAIAAAVGTPPPPRSAP